MGNGVELTLLGVGILAEVMEWNRFTFDIAFQFEEEEPYPPVNFAVDFDDFTISGLTNSIIFENVAGGYLAVHAVQGVAIESGGKGYFLTVFSKAGKITLLAQRD